jgi:hypothetical protein
LCKEEWKGQRYRQSASFTSIEAVTEHYTANGGSLGGDYSKPWGATFANSVNQLLGGGSGSLGLLGDEGSLDSLEGDCGLHLVCQPGNGGPVEDWINVKAFHDRARGVPTCIVNGALDKVRDGYYAPFIFPKLAKTMSFYQSFEPMLFLKPISDKGVYGWLFRVYPEPYQVILQLPGRNKQDKLEVEDIVALVSDKRPSYVDCVKALQRAASERLGKKTA